MIDMPPLHFAEVNGIRIGYYDSGPINDTPPMLLCHGWPELAFSWRHQIKALAAAGIRVIAPDQRGFGATDQPDNVEAYDLAHLTADLVGLLDHLHIDRAIFVGHDWGGFVVWQMPLLYPDRVAGVVGINTPHLPRAPVDPIAILRKRHGDAMYVVQFQDSQAPDRIFADHVGNTFEVLMRKPLPLPPGVAAGKPNLAFPQLVEAYDSSRDRRPPILSAAEKQVFVEAYTVTGFTGGINWYRNIMRNWEAAAGLDPVVRVPALMIMAELDAVLPPSLADGMERLVPDLEKHLVRDSGHWTQQEKPDEVSALLIAWRRRRFG